MRRQPFVKIIDLVFSLNTLQFCAYRSTKTRENSHDAVAELGSRNLHDLLKADPDEYIGHFHDLYVWE